MILITLKKAVKSHPTGGILFRPGELVELTPVKGCAAVGELRARSIIKRVHYNRLFNPPSRNLVCAWIVRNACRSVAGEHVSPGGYDRNGFPCWSLVYGMTQGAS